MISYAKCHGSILIICISNTVLKLSEFLQILRNLSKFSRASRDSDQFFSLPDNMRDFALRKGKFFRKEPKFLQYLTCCNKTFLKYALLYFGFLCPLNRWNGGTEKSICVSSITPVLGFRTHR